MCHLIVRSIWIKVRLFIAQGVTCFLITAILFPKVDASSKSHFIPLSGVQNQSRWRCNHWSSLSLKSWGQGAVFHLWYFWSGNQLHFCASAHRREAKCCARWGQSQRQSRDWTGPRVAAGASRLSYLGLLEARVLRCRFEQRWDTCSFVPWLPGMLTLREFRVGWMRGS